MKRDCSCHTSISGMHCAYRTNPWISSWYTHTKGIAEPILYIFIDSDKILYIIWFINQNMAIM
jgi:hypothetical protein